LIKLLRRYGGPYLGLLFVVLILLIVRAFSELALPQYMSGIVDYGIAQQGVDSPIPQVLTVATFGEIRANFDDPALGNRFAQYYPLQTLHNHGWRDIEFTQPVAAFHGLGANVRNWEQEFIDALARAIARTENADPYLTQPQANQIAMGVIAAEYARLGVDMEAFQMSYVWRMGGLMMAITIISILAAIGQGFISARIATGVARKLRLDIFNKVTSFTNTEYNNFSTATFITRSTNDVNQVQSILAMGIRMIIYSPIMAAGGIVMVVTTDASMAWILFLAIGLILGFVALFYALAAPRFRVIQKLIDKVNLVTREGLTGIMVIRAFGTQKHEEARFDDVNTNLFGKQLFIARAAAFQMPVIMAIMNMSTILIVWFGAHSIQAGNLQVGHMMAFIQYAMFIIMSFLMLSMVFIMMPRASVAAQRIMEVLDTEIVVNDPASPTPIPADRGDIEFRNVKFKFAGAEGYALSDISFTAKSGEITAFVGSTGSGKSSLINLIPRFYDATEGQVLVNGVDVRDAAQKDLRGLIGYIPQKAVLFSGTIESNIKYSNSNMSNADMELAANVAQATEFILEKTEQYNEEIAQGGTNVSGGQRQRLSIARAIAKNPKIYIFDDSFSALDFKTDATLRQALGEHTKDATTLIVAQRIGTIKNAHRIIVLDEGKIVGDGRHRDLLKNCEVYHQIAASQLSDEELARDMEVTA